MKKIIILVSLILCVTLVGNAMALMPGKTAVKETSFMGGTKVTFSGDIHKVNKCGDCHTAVFERKAGAMANPSPHKDGVSCGTCHDGTKATKACTKCHIK